MLSMDDGVHQAKLTRPLLLKVYVSVKFIKVEWGASIPIHVHSPSAVPETL